MNYTLLLIGILSAAPLQDLSHAQSAAHQVQIEAKRFTFSPAEITVPRGQPTTLVVHSADVAHGLLIKDLGVKVDVPKGQSKEVTFTPDKDGDYTGECSRFCGAGHGQMKLTIHVTG